MLKFRRFFITDEQQGKAQIRGVSLFINDGTLRTHRFQRVQLNRFNTFIGRILNSYPDGTKELVSVSAVSKLEEKIKVKQSSTGVISVKKTVRIDDDLYRAIFNEAFFNEDNGEVPFNKLINNSVLKRLESRVINLIPTRTFSHRITLRFTINDYNRIQDLVYYLRDIEKLGWVSFSLVIRSMLYESFDLVREVSNPVLIKDLLSVA